MSDSAHQTEKPNWTYVPRANPGGEGGKAILEGEAWVENTPICSVPEAQLLGYYLRSSLGFLLRWNIEREIMKCPNYSKDRSSS